MKIYVAEMPQSAWDCPFVKDSERHGLHSPKCELCPDKDSVYAGGYEDCSLTHYDGNVEMEQPTCKCLVVLPMK